MKLLFLTGTRADYGKLKRLIEASVDFKAEVSIFITGMHMLRRYGDTHEEITKNHLSSCNLHKFINQNIYSTMDEVLSKTVLGLSDYVKECKPDAIVLHGDRVETLAGAIVASFNNIPSFHIEGGEVSGTLDELIRHSVSKLATFHLVSNFEAKHRLLKMGEAEETVKIIGSPDIDVMLSSELPEIDLVKKHYGISFAEYSILLFHPVTTEINDIDHQINTVLNGIAASNKNCVVIYPNNDNGSDAIIARYEKLNDQFKVFPSMRFEAFITLLKHSMLIIGNSSAGVREAPYFGIATLNIGSRQYSRVNHESVINIGFDEKTISKAMFGYWGKKFQPAMLFGNGRSAKNFISVIESVDLKTTSIQKHFVNY